MKVGRLIWIFGFVAVALLGYWLADTAAPQKEVAQHSSGKSETPRKMVIPDETLPKFRRGDRAPSSHRDLEAAAAGALEGQRILTFKDQAAVDDFLKRAGDRVKLLGRLDALNALRVGFSDGDELAGLLGDGAEQSMVFPVSAPSPGNGSVQPGAVPLGSHLLDWLGVNADNSNWGKGVRIAVLDTGVTANQAFNTSISSIALVAPPSDPAAQNGHGTAVASVIIGKDALTPGVAPAADILSVRIANDSGESDSFLLAKGIVAAVDAGASLINVSMGSFGDSALVRNAIDYAAKAGSLIVAAAGNNGIDQVAYPAANPGVIAVGAVDALGNHLDFSNSGNAIALSAPGYGVNAAWTGNEAVSVSGTSFSSPIVTGAIAAIMTEAGNGKLTPQQAYQRLVSYLNDGGAAGVDPQLGAGMPDIGRALTGNTPGVYDAALASSRILPPDASNPNGQVEILVQNRGTETLINTAVQIHVGGTAVSANLTSLAPGAVQTVRVPVTQPPSESSNGIVVDAKVLLSGGVMDVKPSNDQRVATYVVAGTH